MCNCIEWKKAVNGVDILLDVYNVNLIVMKLILEIFLVILVNEGGKKIVVLVDMKEFGDQFVQFYNQMILSFLLDVFDIVIFYGEDIVELV